MPKQTTVDNSGGNVDKSAEKSAPPKKRVPGRPFQRGGDSRSGRGPKKGAPNAGRPPDAIRALFRETAFAVAQKLQTLANGGTVTTTVVSQGVPIEVEIRPDIDQLTRIADIAAKHGIPAQLEVAGDPTRPLTIRFEE